MKKPREVVRRLAGIATRLWLASPCDRDITIAAAAKVVAQNEEKIRRWLATASDVQPAKKLQSERKTCTHPLDDGDRCAWTV